MATVKEISNDSDSALRNKNNKICSFVGSSYLTPDAKEWMKNYCESIKTSDFLGQVPQRCHLQTQHSSHENNKKARHRKYYGEVQRWEHANSNFGHDESVAHTDRMSSSKRKRMSFQVKEHNIDLSAPRDFDGYSRYQGRDKQIKQVELKKCHSFQLKESLLNGRWQVERGDPYKGMNTIDKKTNLLCLFRKFYKTFKIKSRGEPSKRIDFRVWEFLKKNKFLFRIPKVIGSVCGVKVGDMFNCRLELKIMGIHSMLIRGIDYVVLPNNTVLATSVVTTNGYYDDMRRSDVIIYTGEGGTFEANGKSAKNQTLNKGNSALLNSIEEKNYVRVIRGLKNPETKRTIFIYDGLYRVVYCEKKNMGPRNKALLRFQLDRCSCQKPINWTLYK